ncbi:MAG: TlpA family protein disulfide reductase [Chitinophagaceae bacterium]|nr:TlpA family protein disulfide reductase [Chitinophagaceae bacterium]
MKKTMLLFACVLLMATAAISQNITRVKITDIEKRIDESDKPLVINFWATFCKPCVEEMPHFQKLADEYKSQGIQLLFVSLDLEEDYPATIRQQIKKLKITAPVNWLDEFDADYFCPKIDSTWSGSLPATLFINRNTGYRQFREQVISEAALRKELDAMLQRSAQ